MNSLLVVAATSAEVAPLQKYLIKKARRNDSGIFFLNKLKLQFLVTGVGIFQTSYYLGKFLPNSVVDLAINAGVAGAFNRDLKLGEVVQVTQERFADLGVEEANGHFTDIYELGLIKNNAHPFQKGQLFNPKTNEFDFLPKVKGITVNKVHGYSASIEAIKSKYNPDVESMEGAAFFHACLLESVEFHEIRAISNYVEPRNRANWKLELAINNLNKVLIDLLESF